MMTGDSKKSVTKVLREKARFKDQCERGAQMGSGSVETLLENLGSGED